MNKRYLHTLCLVLICFVAGILVGFKVAIADHPHAHLALLAFLAPIAVCVFKAERLPSWLPHTRDDRELIDYAAMAFCPFAAGSLIGAFAPFQGTPMLLAGAAALALWIVTLSRYMVEDLEFSESSGFDSRIE